MYKQRVTETAVYFAGGPFSQWFPSRFEGRLTPEGEVRTFNCTEQYMMASKADRMGDAAMVDLIMEIVPDEGNAAFFARIDQPGAEAEAAIRRFRVVPRLQKEAGRQVVPFDQTLWEAICDDIVFRANYYKFSQNGPLKAILLNTGQRTLVEGSRYDRIWGVGLDYADERIDDSRNWRGANRLGEAEMRVRTLLDEEMRRPLTPRRQYNPFTMAFE